jgi:hypothetical protein
MDKKTYQKQISSWWIALETEADNNKLVHTAGYKSSTTPKPKKIPENPNREEKKEETEDKEEIFIKDPNPENIIEDCTIVKQAIQKLQQFLITSHKDGCMTPGCSYSSKNFKLKLKVKKLKGELYKKKAIKSHFDLFESNI